MSKSRWFVEKIVSHIYINGIENIRSQNVDQAIYDAIFRRLRETWPSLQVPQETQYSFGFRPYREGGVRVEFEAIEVNDGSGSGQSVIIIHNYGHGATGKFNRQGFCCSI